MKIAYIGIDLFFTALESLENCGCEIEEIFTCETDNKTEFNLKICDFAKKKNIPCQMTRITRDDVERLKKAGCELVVCAGYYFKIPANTGLPIVNIHPSLLPVGRGSWPMPQTILKGMKKSGVTVHKIAEGFDTGDILLQKEFDLDEQESLVSFMEKVYALIPSMMEELVKNFHELWRNARAQQGEEYWEAPTESDMTVRADMTAQEADRVLRAFLGYECYYEGKERFEIIGGRAFKGEREENSLSLLDGYIKYEKISRI